MVSPRTFQGGERVKVWGSLGTVARSGVSLEGFVCMVRLLGPPRLEGESTPGRGLDDMNVMACKGKKRMREMEFENLELTL